MEAAKTACLPSCIGDWRRAVGRKAGTDIGVNSCLVALIASETVSIALSWLLLQFWNDIVAKILSFISLPNLKRHGQSNIKLDWHGLPHGVGTKQYKCS